jgi:hydroxymethylpyrimidine kinase/phosphomethylpyrimidine kinase
MTRVDRPTVLVVGGSDPIGAAGIQADLRHLAACGVHGAAVPTALTVQRTDAVLESVPVDVSLFRRMTEAVFASLDVDVVLTGMLANEAILRTLLVILHEFTGRIVVDPVFRATAGASLLDDGGRDLVREALIVRAHVVLPNAAEACALAGLPERFDDASLTAAANDLIAQGAENVLVKGGHSEGDPVVDLLATPRGIERLTAPRLPGFFRGAGGALAAATAAALAHGAEPVDAIKAAREKTTAALKRASAAGTPFLNFTESTAR